MPTSPSEPEPSTRLRSLHVRFVSAVGRLGDLGTKISTRLRVAPTIVASAALVAYIGLGIGVMGIGEWAAAVLLWVTLGLAFLARLWVRDENEGDTKRYRLRTVGGVILAGVLILITILRKPPDEPWSSLERLWIADSRYGIAMTSLAANGALPVWGLEDVGSAHVGYFCQVPMLAEVYVTNKQSRSSTVTKIRVEALDTIGKWRGLDIAMTNDLSPVYFGPDLHHVKPWVPIDGKFFDQELFGKNMGPGETRGGWMFLNQHQYQFSQGLLRFFVWDLDGGPYRIGPISTGSELLEGGFRMKDGFADLSHLVKEDCPAWQWR